MCVRLNPSIALFPSFFVNERFNFVDDFHVSMTFWTSGNGGEHILYYNLLRVLLE